MSARSLPAALPADDLNGPALRGFFRLSEHWKLRVAEQRKLLGDPPESTFYKWKREQDGSLGRVTLSLSECAMPKSATLSRIRSSSSKLAGFRSR